ncbi:MAG: ester cyclase [Gammaproteobacteria bacterium]
MNALDVASRYFDAWNHRDAGAFVSIFTRDGTYCDPLTDGEIEAGPFAAYAQSLWSAFPDLSFKIVSMAECGSGEVAAQWLMTGTNGGAYRGLPPTGNAVALPGADFIAVEHNQIRSITAYFDTSLVPKQLGLQAIVQPHELGSFVFGTSVSVQSGRKVAPGAFSIGQITSTTKDEMQETREAVRDIGKELLNMKGFIGLTAVRLGARGVMLAAWEHPEDAERIVEN